MLISRVRVLTVLAFSIFWKSSVAQLVLTIDEYTTDTLTFSISGSFEADTIGDFSGWLAIKNAWQGNQGVHTELFSSTPSVVSQSITIGGLSANTAVENGSQTYNDSIYWQNPLGFNSSISALTVVDGSVTLSGPGIFDPVNNNQLTLVSGLSLSPYDWARLETVGNAIPETSNYIVILGVLSLAAVLWRKKGRSDRGKHNLSEDKLII